MSFWEKIKKLIPLKHVLFVGFLLVLTIVISLFESGEDVKVAIGQNAVDITASNYQMSIPYEMIDSLELVKMPEEGNNLQGTDNLVVRTGNWENETWGEYYVCADLDATNCIVAHLNDGRIFVFSRKSNQETADIYESLLMLILN